MDIYFAGGKFRAEFKFANIGKMSFTRKIHVIRYPLINVLCLGPIGLNKIIVYLIYSCMIAIFRVYSPSPSNEVRNNGVEGRD